MRAYSLNAPLALSRQIVIGIFPLAVSEQFLKILISEFAARNKFLKRSALFHHFEPFVLSKAEKLAYIIAGIQRRDLLAHHFKGRYTVSEAHNQLMHIFLKQIILADQIIRLFYIRNITAAIKAD